MEWSEGGKWDNFNSIINKSIKKKTLSFPIPEYLLNIVNENQFIKSNQCKQRKYSYYNTMSKLTYNNFYLNQCLFPVMRSQQKENMRPQQKGQCFLHLIFHQIEFLIKPEPSEIHDQKTKNQKTKQNKKNNNKENCPERDGELQLYLIYPEFCTAFSHESQLSHLSETRSMTSSAQHNSFTKKESYLVSNLTVSNCGLWIIKG